jgi:hypothetical protein
MQEIPSISGVAAAVENDDPFHGPHLPERYRQKVRENRKRRLWRQILLAVLIIAMVIGLVLAAGFISRGQQHPAMAVPTGATPVPGTTGIPSVAEIPAPEYTIGSGVPVVAAGGSIALADAASALARYYPSDTYAIRMVNYSTSSGHSLFGFTLQPADTAADPVVVFIDAATGSPWTAGQETAAISEEKAREVVTSAFPDVPAPSVSAWYHDTPGTGAVWNVIFSRGNSTLLSASVDAASGEIIGFSRGVPRAGRQPDPVVSSDAAEKIAFRYISDHNEGDLPLNLTVSRYEAWGTPSDPEAGRYVFSWEREFLDYPVDTDYILVAVDSLDGQVIGYRKRWTTQNYAFSQTVMPTVVQRDATFSVMEAAKERFPDSVESVRIISTGIRWNNRNAAGTSQRPGSVPLEWKVVFDDATIRANSSLAAGTGWVDIQTGNVTAMEYRH